MTQYYDKNVNRVLELLNYPILERCNELKILFNECNIHELQDIFPNVVQSVFGIGNRGIGWGLRTTTKKNAPQFFDTLFEFFAPMGPIFQICYRLLNDAIKFEINLDQLPHKINEMIQTGQYSIFYADLFNVDTFRRQVISLSLNAFDYYILHFCIYATFPLHKMYPAALQVHNEHMKTVYFFLTAEYLCNFLPCRPDSVVMPPNICPTVKAPQPMPIQPLQPKRSPKYLKIPSASVYDASSSNTQFIRNTVSPRVHAWRTESVLHFFIDTWLRYDVDETRDLPSSEFIRVVRILIKQTHSFANSAYIDETPMVTLRKLAQPMMRVPFYPFLKSTMGRWPLDSSFSVVLELWLSYIQPWRYGFDWQLQKSNENNIEFSSDNRYQTFILDNLIIYTQIFVHILPRFERLDFTSLPNVIMLHRLVKVFNQTGLPAKLLQAEQSFGGNYLKYDSPRKQNTFLCAANSTGSYEWDNLHYDDGYTPMFGDAMQNTITKFLKTICIARDQVIKEIIAKTEENEERYKSFGIFKRIFNKIFEEMSCDVQKMKECNKIPDILESAMNTLGGMFNVDVPDISGEEIDTSSPNCTQANFSLYDDSNYLDVSHISPFQMMNNLANIKASVDPALLPIQTYECAFLVRLLHRLSCKMNEKFHQEIEALWYRSDIKGKLARRIFYGPMTAQWFDKPYGKLYSKPFKISMITSFVGSIFPLGESALCEQQLPPRLSLRYFASYQCLFFVAIFCIIGYIKCHTVIIGVITAIMVLLTFLYMCSF
ncbi:sphingomyelin phosphodiesterase 4 isoform X2 [Glossina fuscipes]|uniref:Sphingomyelin phosphodiesterase 4 isoform X2 n=1 Tax=Glossina fuscipes TaxID=7396 RepID=A0A9C6DXP5_9MUSC|nr:sphingomyelin phosphodiesterase 4 isoform X2 [Glossina fuscipes]